MTDRPRKQKTTSHWAVSEEHCQRMADKYGWELDEVIRRIDANDPLVVECRFLGDAEFPPGRIDYTKGKDR